LVTVQTVQAFPRYTYCTYDGKYTVDIYRTTGTIESLYRGDFNISAILKVLEGKYSYFRLSYNVGKKLVIINILQRHIKKMIKLNRTV